MIERTFDPVLLALYANHPEVRPHIGMVEAGPLEFSEWMANPANVCLAVRGGCFCFGQDEPGRFELHTFLTPEARGARVIPAFYAAARWMFTQTPCVEIITRLPETNRPADLMARRAGFQPLYTLEKAWEGVDLRYFTLTLDKWVAVDPATLEAGRAFHERVDTARVEAGREDTRHPDSEAHNRAVGAAVLMAQAGNHDKALWAYNRFARVSGYVPAKVVPQAPVVDIGDAHIRFTPDLEIVGWSVQP